jgi:hypothetical protein
MHGCIRLSAVHPMAIVPPICFTTIAAIVIPILDNDDDKDIPVRGIINTHYKKNAITHLAACKLTSQGELGVYL